MSFQFPADKLDFTAPNGITYTWDADDNVWRVKSYKAEDPDARLPYRVETEPAGDPQVQLVDAQDQFSSVKFEGSDGIDVSTNGPDTLSFSGATLTPRAEFEADQQRQDELIDELLGYESTKGLYTISRYSNNDGQVYTSSLSPVSKNLAFGAKDAAGRDTPELEVNDLIRVANLDEQNVQDYIVTGKVEGAPHSYRVDPITNTGTWNDGDQARVTFSKKISTDLEQRVSIGEATQVQIQGTIDDALETQADLVDTVETLNNKVNALEGSVIDAIWTFEEDDRIPRAGEFALRAGTDVVTGDWQAANQIIFNTVDFKGDTYTFEKITVNDVIRCGAADGTGAEYKVTSIIGQGWFGVEHLRSSPDAADEQEYAFTFLSSFDPEGLATINYVDAQDALKLNLTGGTLTNRLFFDRGSGGANMVISPNSGDVNTAVYALNGGYIRFRSSLTEDLNNGVNTHITFGRNPDTNTPQTNIYHLQYPQESTHAANKQYVDDQIGNIDIPDPDLSSYLPLTGGTITGPLTLQSNQNFMVKDASEVENFRVQANGFCRTTDLFRSQRDDGGPGFQARIGSALNAEIRCDGKATFKNDVTFRDGGRIYVNRDANEAIFIQQSGTNKAKIWSDGTFETEKTTFSNKNLVTKKYVDDQVSDVIAGGHFYMSSGSLYFEVD